MRRTFMLMSMEESQVGRMIGVVFLVLVFLVAGALTAGADVHLNNFTADLSGENHLDDSGDPDGTGSAVVVIDLDTSEVCFTITFDGIEDPVAAHIHEGGADVAGGVVVDFDWPNSLGDGCVAGDAAVVAAIVADPGGYYVNVHTAEFAAGAIRGQLVAAAAVEPPAEELPATGSNFTLFLLLAGAALTAGGAIVYVNRQSHPTQ
ncbi:MAG: CHRD domain-containing protein [Acidimicrobiia bacterium]